MATKLEISELDFDGIKSNLKTFLSQQNEFTDYDFEGSGMSVLLDVLAYNTHYLGIQCKHAWQTRCILIVQTCVLVLYHLQNKLVTLQQVVHLQQPQLMFS